MSTQSLGFTLLELIVVIVIIAILAVISFPKFTIMKESSFDREAITNLKIIQDAEKYYKMEMVDSYYPSSGSETNITAINSNLSLNLPTSASRAWDYKVEYVSATDFKAKARRTTDATKVKCIDEDDENPTDCPW